MNPRRVLIVNIQSVLIGAAESLIQNHEGFALTNIYPTDIHSLIYEIKRVEPHVIVMDEDTFFVEQTRIFISLWDMPHIRLIVLNNRRNVVDVFDKHERAISHPGQLIDVIESYPGIYTLE